MLNALLSFIQILVFLSFFCLIVGLIRPVLVLWFLDRFNRLLVIKIYGSCTLGLLVLWVVMEFFIGLR